MKISQPPYLGLLYTARTRLAVEGQYNSQLIRKTSLKSMIYRGILNIITAL